MRCKGLLIVVLILLVSGLVFAAPTVAPPKVGGFGSSSDTVEPDEETPAPNSLFGDDLPVEPNVPGSDSKDIEPEVNSNEVVKTNSTSSDEGQLIFIMIMIGFLNLVILIVILVVLVMILMGKKSHLDSPPRPSQTTKDDLEYDNSRDSIQYTQTFYKLENYIKSNLDHFSFDSIKSSLLGQGFTAEEIDAVYYEIKKK